MALGGSESTGTARVRNTQVRLSRDALCCRTATAPVVLDRVVAAAAAATAGYGSASIALPAMALSGIAQPAGVERFCWL